MKNLVALVFLCITSACQGIESPTFEWIQTTDPVLKITYPNGVSDLTVLKTFNPIPLQSFERQEDVDACIYDGYLVNEENVYVTLTGCAQTNNFNIQFRSQHLDHYMFNVVEGQAVPVQSVFSQKFVNRNGELQGVYDKVVRFQPKANFSGSERALNPRGYQATVKIRYDENFNAKHGANAMNVIRRIFAQAQNIWRWPSLTSSVTFVIDPKVDAVRGRFVAETDIDEAAVYSTTAVNINVMLAYRNNQPGTVGIAYMGSVCSPAQLRVALCEYFNDDMKSAEVVAHEIGHNMNMDHDFVDEPGQTRYDSRGRKCSDIGGVMDYYGVVNKWSTCSVEDFTALTGQRGFCLKAN